MSHSPRNRPVTGPVTGPITEQAGASPAEVVLINTFEVPAGKEEEAVAAWEKARDFLAGQPGYIATALHRALAPDARYPLINVARWESAERFAAATQRMREAEIFPEIEGLRYTPGLYRVIRSD